MTELAGSEVTGAEVADAWAADSSVAAAESGTDNARLDTLIVGAGPAGLAAARALLVRGLPYTQVERSDRVGGIWDIDAPGSPMYESAHFISSRTLSGFAGFPMPDDFPDYPSHRQILQYLRAFADAYGLEENITFNTTVTNVERTEAGTYKVTRLTNATAQKSTKKPGKAATTPRSPKPVVTEHAQVIVASGSQWTPIIPSIHGTFSGEIRHSSTYRDPSEFVGKRVLIMGAGNSGADIACDAARTADRAYISARRGYWLIPKHIFGMPSDVFADRGPALPMWLEQAVFGAMLRVINGDVRRWGLPKPDHKLFETHPLMNTQLLHHLQHGDVTAKPAVATASGASVTFVDGTVAEVGLIVLATGYRRAVPFAQDLMGDAQQPNLYLNTFSPHTGLYGVGFIETNGASYPLMSQLSAMIAQHIEDRGTRPTRWVDFEQMILNDQPDLTRGLRLIDSPRHLGYVDTVAMTRYLKKVCKRMGWKLPA